MKETIISVLKGLLVIGFLFALLYWGGSFKSQDLKPRSVHVELQTEEPLSPGDSLQVLDITKGKDQDTIWIGYLH